MRKYSLLALLVLVACGGGGGGTDPGGMNSSATLTITAHVVPPAGTPTCNATTCPPISGVAINIQNQTATTGNDGRATISSLTPGPTTVTMNKTGYAPFSTQLTLVTGANSASLGMTPQ